MRTFEQLLADCQHTLEYSELHTSGNIEGFGGGIFSTYSLHEMDWTGSVESQGDRFMPSIHSRYENSHDMSIRSNFDRYRPIAPKNDDTNQHFHYSSIDIFDHDEGIRTTSFVYGIADMAKHSNRYLWRDSSDSTQAMGQTSMKPDPASANTSFDFSPCNQSFEKSYPSPATLDLDWNNIVRPITPPVSPSLSQKAIDNFIIADPNDIQISANHLPKNFKQSDSAGFHRYGKWRRRNVKDDFPDKGRLSRKIALSWQHMCGEEKERWIYGPLPSFE